MNASPEDAGRPVRVPVRVPVEGAPQPRLGAGHGRRLIWEDQFAGPAGASPDRASWTAELGAGGWGNGELQTYTDAAENVALDGDGHLVVSA